jgi:hypothetical protein
MLKMKHSTIVKMFSVDLWTMHKPWLSTLNGVDSGNKYSIGTPVVQNSHHVILDLNRFACNEGNTWFAKNPDLFFLTPCIVLL